MKGNRLLESLGRDINEKVVVRRYTLAEMISESYRAIYSCSEDSNLRKLAESHLQDVKDNPRDISRLSRQLCTIKELIKLTESGELKDEDLVDKKYHDTVDPKKDRVIHEDCSKSSKSLEESTGAIGAKVGDTIVDTKTGKEGKVQKVGTSGNYSILYVDFGSGLRRINPMDDAQTTGRYSLKKESIKESDDPDLTDEELEELAKHLETIRKERKNTPKTEMKEDIAPRRGIKCSVKDSKDCKKVINEASESYVSQYGVDILTEDGQPDIEYKIEHALAKAGLKVLGCQPTDASWSVEEYEKMTGMSINDILGESKKEKIDDCNESKSYKGLENFKKQSESKAFYKTFKKLHESLKEGKALTRQESIDLYKASNSALTQLSIELEHNPEFLGTFKESVSLLSKDVTSLLESLTRGKAPSKATMKSIAKFSEALLYEENHPEYASDFKVLDTIPVGPDYVVQICYIDDTYSKDHYGVQVVDTEGNPVEGIKDVDDLTYDKLFNTESGAREVANKIVPILSTKYSVNESDDEDEELDDIETPEEDFIGDDEGDVQSEEADEFDQEYADARFELHSDLESKHADDEDPEVQGKLDQDAEEIINLPGTTDEQIAKLNGEESNGSEEGETPEDGESEDVDDSDITDDELEELKKHLTEMRAAKKN